MPSPMHLLSNREKVKILIVRPDRIGDVVLSTPVFTSIKKSKPNWKVYALLRPMVADLIDGHENLDGVIRLSTDDKPSISNIAGLSSKLRAEKFDVVIHLYSDFWISLATFLAKIPLRIGTTSKLAQIFYNKRISQKRSSGKKHEADYNLELLKPLGIEPVRKSSVPFLKELPDRLTSLIDATKKNIGIFPGMGGSARNWKPKQYAKLADELIEKDFNIVLIAGLNEEVLINSVAELQEEKSKKSTATSLKELAGFIKRLDCFIAPSTGPLHIATAVETPAVGIYCPIKVCLPTRWGPIGENDIGLVPDVEPCERCSEEQCEEYDCMDKLPVDEVLRRVLERV